MSSEIRVKSAALPKQRGVNHDYLKLLIPPLVLSLLGIMFIYSGSNYTALKETGDAFFFVKKQLISFLIGLICMVILSILDYRKLKKYKWAAIALALILLALVFVPGISIEHYGAKRWIGFGSFSIQPSEFSKFLFVLFVAAYFADVPDFTFKRMLPVLAAGGAMCVLIMLEPNMSITMCVGCVMFVMLFGAGCKAKHLAAIGAPCAAAVPLLIIAEPYRMKRLLAFLDPWASPKNEGYQLIQSLYALGSGGLFGVGIFNSRQKFEFLPFSESDFIFSIIGEETGVIGCLLVISVFLFLIYQGIKLSMKCPDRFGALLVLGITAVIAVQTVINIAVVSGSIPPTGLPLPFMSYGGSSLIVFLAAVGVLLSVSRSVNNSAAFAIS